MKKPIFYREYSPEELASADLTEEVQESLREAESLPDGKFRVRVQWCSEDDCDCTGFNHRYDCPHYVMQF